MTVLEIESYGRNTLRRLRRESRIVDATAMPGLAPAYEIDPWAPTTTLVTEYLPDVTLDDLVSVSPLPAAAALHALRDVARTLHAMHECGLVHGDLGPAAVFILPDGRAALARPETAPPATATSRTRAMRTDAHGFATLAFEALTGVHPLDPAEAGPMATSLPVLPRAAADVLARALDAAPSRRPLPLDLVTALDAIPAEEWTTNQLGRALLPDPARLAPPLPPAEPVVVAEPMLAPALAPALETEPVAAPAPAPRVVVRIVPPRTRRSLFRRILGPFVMLVGLLTVLSGGGAGAWLLFAPASADDPVVDPIRVRRVTVSITPPQAMCPRASLHLAASIVTEGGGGDLVVTWRLPDGTVADTQALSVDEGRRTLLAAFDLTLTGERQLVGDVVAVVSPTGDRASARIRYLCPGAPETGRKRSQAV